MLFNVIALFLLALAVERAIGPFVLILLWLLSGIAENFCQHLFCATTGAVAPGVKELGFSSRKTLVSSGTSTFSSCIRQLRYPLFVLHVIVRILLELVPVGFRTEVVRFAFVFCR